MKFSVVIPVRDEIDLLRRNLPSWCALQPDEIVLCFDKPAPWQMIYSAWQIVKPFGMWLTIVEADRNPSYSFHQAWVRRCGFHKARNDVILTGDIDLEVYPSCLEALKLVGKDNVGLASCLKHPRVRNVKALYVGFWSVLRRMGIRLFCWYKKKPLPSPVFTGLYALYRPYWLDTEDSGIKDLPNPKHKQVYKVHDSYLDVYPLGEDTYLRDCMMRKHRVVYLPVVGALSHNEEVEQDDKVQFLIGYYHGLTSRTLKHPVRLALIHAVSWLQPNYLRGFLQAWRS